MVVCRFYAFCRYAAFITTAGDGCATGLMEVADPAFLEVFKVVAFDYRFWAGALVAGADAEGFQQTGQGFGLHWLVFTPCVPGTVVQGVKELQQVGGGDPLGMVFGCKEITDIGQDLPGAIKVFEAGQGKCVDQGLAGALRPVAADEVGDLK